MVEIQNEDGQLIGTLPHSHGKEKIVLFGFGYKVHAIDMALRIEPGKFAMFHIEYTRLPMHVITQVVQLKDFRARGLLSFVENLNDPELKTVGKPQ